MVLAEKENGILEKNLNDDDDNDDVKPFNDWPNDVGVSNSP